MISKKQKRNHSFDTGIESGPGHNGPRSVATPLRRPEFHDRPCDGCREHNEGLPETNPVSEGIQDGGGCPGRLRPRPGAAPGQQPQGAEDNRRQPDDEGQH